MAAATSVMQEAMQMAADKDDAARHVQLAASTGRHVEGDQEVFVLRANPAGARVRGAIERNSMTGTGWYKLRISRVTHYFQDGIAACRQWVMDDPDVAFHDTKPIHPLCSGCPRAKVSNPMAANFVAARLRGGR